MLCVHGTMHMASVSIVVGRALSFVCVRPFKFFCIVQYDVVSTIVLYLRARNCNMFFLVVAVFNVFLHYENNDVHTRPKTWKRTITKAHSTQAFYLVCVITGALGRCK